MKKGELFLYVYSTLPTKRTYLKFLGILIFKLEEIKQTVIRGHVIEPIKLKSFIYGLFSVSKTLFIT